MDVLLPVVAKNQPETAQGVFRTVSFPGTFTDPMEYIVPLGYLVSIWQKLNHMSFPGEWIPILNAPQEGHFDCAEKFKNWEISYVEVEIVSYPLGDDMIFGETPNILAGRCGFFVSSLSKRGFEWGLITPIKTTATLQIYAGLGNAPPGFPLIPPTVQPTGFIPGTFGETRGINATNFRANEQIPIYVSGTTTLGFEVQKPKPKIQLKGGIENATYSYFPVQYLNFKRNTFDAPSPRANGFWWKFKPGVVANITIFGTLIEPGVEAGPTESGNVKFNPMKGEELP